MSDMTSGVIRVRTGDGWLPIQSVVGPTGPTGPVAPTVIPDAEAVTGQAADARATYEALGRRILQSVAGTEYSAGTVFRTEDVFTYKGKLYRVNEGAFGAEATEGVVPVERIPEMASEVMLVPFGTSRIWTTDVPVMKFIPDPKATEMTDSLMMSLSETRHSTDDGYTSVAYDGVSVFYLPEEYPEYYGQANLRPGELELRTYGGTPQEDDTVIKVDYSGLSVFYEGAGATPLEIVLGRLNITGNDGTSGFQWSDETQAMQITDSEGAWARVYPGGLEFSGMSGEGVAASLFCDYNYEYSWDGGLCVNIPEGKLCVIDPLNAPGHSTCIGTHDIMLSAVDEENTSQGSAYMSVTGDFMLDNAEGYSISLWGEVGMSVYNPFADSYTYLGPLTNVDQMDATFVSAEDIWSATGSIASLSIVPQEEIETAALWVYPEAKVVFGGSVDDDPYLDQDRVRRLLALIGE